MAEPRKQPLPPYKLRDAAVIGFGLTLAALVVGCGVGYLNAGRLADSSGWVAHTHEVIGALEALLSTLTDAETGQRGYLLAEDEKYLERMALSVTVPNSKSLRHITLSNLSMSAKPS